MKELLIKEKAKAYDGLIERLKDLKFAYRFSPLSDTIEEKFPELKDEDERIREALIDGFTVMKESKNCGKTFSNHNIPVADILAWLEKQGKQKSEWTPMDEQRVENLLAIIEGHGYPMEVEWLKSLKSRVQPKQQWSEEDEMMIKFALTYFRMEGATEDSDIIKWLKSLRPQKQWKPSNRELGAILAAIGDERQKGSDAAKELQKIYQHLKKLMEE